MVKVKKNRVWIKGDIRTMQQELAAAAYAAVKSLEAEGFTEAKAMELVRESFETGIKALNFKNGVVEDA